MAAKNETKTLSASQIADAISSATDGALQGPFPADTDKRGQTYILTNGTVTVLVSGIAPADEAHRTSGGHFSRLFAQLDQLGIRYQISAYSLDATVQAARKEQNAAERAAFRAWQAQQRLNASAK